MIIIIIIIIIINYYHNNNNNNNNNDNDNNNNNNNNNNDNNNNDSNLMICIQWNFMKVENELFLGSVIARISKCLSKTAIPKYLPIQI